METLKIKAEEIISKLSNEKLDILKENLKELQNNKCESTTNMLEYVERLLDADDNFLSWCEE